jgi:hypothetical protein
MTTAVAELVKRRPLSDGTALLYYADGSVWHVTQYGTHELLAADEVCS